MSRRILVAFALAAFLVRPAASSAQEPPTSPPAGWGPMSINLEDVPYPHPVAYLCFVLEGQDVRMAYMDVPPLGTPNGKSVVLLHGMNFFGEAWTETIEILRKEGYRVVVPDQIGFRPIVEADPALFNQHARREHETSHRSSRHQDDGYRHALDGRDGGKPLRLVISRRRRQSRDDQSDWTDRRAEQRPWRETSEVYKAALARDYAEIVRGMRAYYVKWKPEYMKYVKIHYGWITSGDWPRMAMVRALQQQAIYADPVVDDWPRIKARTLVIGGEKDGADYPGQARRVAETVQNGQLYVIPSVGHNPQFESPELLYPPLLRFLRGEDVGIRKASARTSN